MQLGIGSRHVGEKVNVIKIKKVRGVNCHAISDAQVIRNRRVDEELP